jgi:phosphohistidine phosphatase
MQLILFRHGPAGHPDPSRWPDDRARPLTERGEEKTRAAAKGLARLLGDGTRVWTSPLARAHRTAEILVAANGGHPPHVVAALASGGSVRSLLEQLAAASRAAPEGTIVVVGHEPELGRLAGLLLVDSGRALPLKKAGACALSFDGVPGKQLGDLEWFLPPRVLRALGARARAGHGAS